MSRQGLKGRCGRRAVGLPSVGTALRLVCVDSQCWGRRTIDPSSPTEPLSIVGGRGGGLRSPLGRGEEVEGLVRFS